MEKSTQICTTIKHLLISNFDQFCLFVEQVKTIIFQRFQKNVNMFLKKKMIPKYIIDDIEISIREINSDKKTADEENFDKEHF